MYTVHGTYILHYRTATTHRMPYLYRSFPAKESLIKGLFGGK